jgi:hypothetical protein
MITVESAGGMSGFVVNLLPMLLTGSVVTLVVSVLNFHARFIRLEDSMRRMEKQMSVLRRTVMRRLPRITVNTGWTDEEKESEDEQW